MKNPSIIYWKWDDSYLETEKYLEYIQDIVTRSPFSHLYITTHWCHNGIASEDMHHHVKQACDAIHQKGRKMVFEIDVRAEKALFATQNPEHRLAFTYWSSVSSDTNSFSFRISGSQGGVLFAGDRQSGEALIDILVYQTDILENINEASIRSIRNKANIQRTDAQTVTVKWSSEGIPEDAKIFIAVASLFDFPDYYSSKYYEFLDFLLHKYEDIPLDGLAVDELGIMWYPGFDFTPGSYMALDNSPIYSKNMDTMYTIHYGNPYLHDLLYRFCSSLTDPRRIRAVNRYFEWLRTGISKAENYFYDSAKKIYGRETFVGVHNTWYAIEEVQNSPEIWKTGITWWSVRKDYGFTDEILLYPVRTALAHKASSHLFYNMWYSEATMDLNTFYTEIWKNVRYGGRTISLSYECIHEKGTVIQLRDPGKLEAIAAMETIIQGVDHFICSSARCDIAVLTCLSAMCSILCNMNGNQSWDSLYGILKENFTLTRDIFISGYNCDMIGDCEVYDQNLYIGDDGYVTYGNQTYTCLILSYPQFCKKELFHFMKQVKKSRTKLFVIGKADTCFDGSSISDEYNELLDECIHYAYRPEISDLLYYFGQNGISGNRVQNGCYMQDGSLILTAPAPDKPTGNIFESTFRHQNHLYKIIAEDVVCIRFNSEGIDDIWSPKLICCSVE